MTRTLWIWLLAAALCMGACDDDDKEPAADAGNGASSGTDGGDGADSDVDADSDSAGDPRQSCVDDADCPEETVCNVVVCERLTCQVREDCGPNRGCQPQEFGASICVPGCTTNSDCEGDLICNAFLCVDP